MSDGLEFLKHYLRFATVSADPSGAEPSSACCRWLSETLGSWGMQAGVHSTAGGPVVVARTPHVENAMRVLVYGHYDVQPAEPLDLWQSGAFEPEVREGMIYARGATDNKGQTASLLLGIRDLIKSGTLDANVTVLLEGEEEIGSPSLQDFLNRSKDDLECDVVLIADTSMIKEGLPALTLGLRGIVCMEVKVHGAAADLHSGMFGGAVPNPAMVLAKVLGRMTDANGVIAIPAFYEGSIEIPSEEREAWAALPWDDAWFQNATGIAPAGERGTTAIERAWGRPTAEINGLTSGHQGEGSKTIIPATAAAKLSFRLVPGQDPQRIAAITARWFEEQCAAEGAKGIAVCDHVGEPFYTSPENPFLRRAADALEEVFRVAPALTREGLSIPAAVMLQKTLDVPVILVGLGLPDCQAHAPNECFPVAHLELGAEFVKRFLAQRRCGAAVDLDVR